MLLCDTGLERSLELVRINLVAKDPKTGSERMLRIATEVGEGLEANIIDGLLYAVKIWSNGTKKELLICHHALLFFAAILEVLEDGRMRTRNQKLAQVVTKGAIAVQPLPKQKSSRCWQNHMGFIDILSICCEHT
eukprot:5650653-Amphidinium_carterae.1